LSDVLVERKNVGSKGEILPSKRLREKVGLKAGDPIEIKVKGDTLIVRAAPDPLKELNGILDIDLTIKDLKKIAERQVVKEACKKIVQTHKTS
jgi:bifunctional DNA-binding transcriptional regulator/antitoxin component of YhaV-PrlF toxin-antitoxin module